MARHVKVLIDTEALCGRDIFAFGAGRAGRQGAEAPRKELLACKIRIDPQLAHADLVLAAAAAAWCVDRARGTAY